MELTLILSAAIFTLLAIVVATSLLCANPPRSSARREAGDASAAGLEPPGPEQKAADDRRQIVNDHWDVMKCVPSVSHTQVWMFFFFVLFHYVILS